MSSSSAANVSSVLSRAFPDLYPSSPPPDDSGNVVKKKVDTNNSFREETKRQDEELASLGLLVGLDVPEPAVAPPTALKHILEHEDQRVLRKTAPRQRHNPSPLHQRKKKDSTTTSASTSSSSLLAMKPQLSKEPFASNNGVKKQKKKSQSRHEKKRELLQTTVMQSSQITHNKSILEKMSTNLSYLKNPRYSLAAGADATTNSSIPFRAIPSAGILFDTFVVGGRYCATLSLLNTDGLSRRIAILPPSSPYFAIGPVKYPTDTTLIAPGMECTVQVFFAPDALHDFEDELEITTDGGQFTVPIAGRKVRPILDLAPVLDCGVCHVGHVKENRWVIHNQGGPANVHFQLEDSNKSFEVAPTHMILAPGETCELTVRFAPRKEDNYEKQSCRLIIEHDTEDVESVRIVGQPSMIDLVATHVDGYPLSHALQKLLFDDAMVGGVLERTVTWENHSHLAIPFRFDCPLAELFSASPREGVFAPLTSTTICFSFHPSQVQSERAVISLLVQPDPTAIFSQLAQLDCYGRGKPFHVELSIPLLAQDMAIGTAYATECAIINHTGVPTTFQWRAPSPAASKLGLRISFSPASGEAPSEFDVIVDASQATATGSESLVAECLIGNGETLSLPIQVHVRGPTVLLEQALVDFGWLNFGVPKVSASQTICLRNQSDTIAALCCLESDPRLHFSQTSDISIPPGDSCDIVVTFRPTAVGSLRTNIVCHVAHGNSCFVAVHGEVVAPKLKVSPLCVRLSRTYKDIPNAGYVTVQNMTGLPALIEWEDFLTPEQQCVVRMEPPKAAIEGRQAVEFKVNFLGSAIGPFSTVCACDVRGSGVPLGFELVADVQDLQISYHLASPEEAERANWSQALSRARQALLRWTLPPSHMAHETPRQQALFQEQYLDEALVILDDASFGRHDSPWAMTRIALGDACPIFSQVKRTVVLRNHSGISTKFSLSFGKYGVPYVDATSSALHSTARIDASFHSMAGSQFTREQQERQVRDQILSGGQGVAFMVHPARGSLKPFGCVTVHITCLNDMCGDFEDELICQITGLPERRFPVTIGVFGSPLSFDRHSSPGFLFPDGVVAPPALAGIPSDHAYLSHPTLSFSSVPQGSSDVSKTLVLHNAGPVDIRLDWSVHDASKESFTSIVMFQCDVTPDGKVETSLEAYRPLPAAPSFPVSLPVTQLVVPARGSASLSVTFAPSQMGSFSGFAKAAVSVRPYDAQREQVETQAKKKKSVFTTTKKNNETKKTNTIASGKSFSMASTLHALDAFERSLKRDPDSSDDDDDDDDDDDVDDASADADEEEVKKEEEDSVPSLEEDKEIQKMEEWSAAPASLLRYPVHFNFIGETTLPGLLINKGVKPDGEQLLRFKVTPHGTTKARSLPLTNVMRTPLSFTLTAEPRDMFKLCLAKNQLPFHPMSKNKNLLSLATTTNLSGDSFQLAPNQNAAIGIQAVTLPPKQWPQAQVTTHTGELTVAFSNGTSQHIPLECVLYRPRLVLAQRSFDFASVQVGSSRTFHLQLRNNSHCDTHWRAVHSRRPPPPHKKRHGLSTIRPDTLKQLSHPEFDEHLEHADDTTVFKFDCTQGVISEKDQVATIAITFTPKRHIQYISTLDFFVEHGFPAKVSFQLSGTGSLDEDLE